MTTNGVQIDSSRYAQLQDGRAFYQPGGPGNRKYFYDLETSAFFVTGAIVPILGTIDPIYIPDPRRAGRYLLAGRQRNAPELPTLTIAAHEKRGGIPRYLLANQCDTNFYVLRGLCGDLSDFYNGWDDFVWVFSRYRYEGNIDLGNLTIREGDGPRENTLNLKGVSVYPKGAISFGEEAASAVVVEVIDAVFGNNITCADCGLPNDGSQVAYALTRANVGSPSAPGQLLYTTDGGLTWTNAGITGIGVSAEPRYLDIAGSILFVGTSLTSLFYAALNANTAAPGTWSSVALPVAMTDTFVQSASSIFFVGASGVVYRTTNIATAPTLIATASGTPNLARIHGLGETLVAVGAAGTVYYSLNSGTTWALATAPVGAALTAVAVVSAREWWVGTAAGEVWRTTNGGVSWTEVDFPGSGTGNIEDLLFATRDILYISHTISSTARLVISGDGGNTFARDDSTKHIQSWPTFAKAGRLAAPSSEDKIAANYLMVAGLAAGGTDGLLLLGAPTLV